MHVNEFSIGSITAIVLATTVIAAIVGTVFSPEKSIEILGFAAIICTSLLTLLKVETVETKAIEQRAEIHTLVDANLDLQLQTSATSLRRDAAVTGDESAIVAADSAEKALKERIEIRNGGTK